MVSVANLTKRDGIDFLYQVPGIGIVSETTRYPINQAIEPSPISVPFDLRARRFSCHKQTLFP